MRCDEVQGVRGTVAGRGAELRAGSLARRPLTATQVQGYLGEAHMALYQENYSYFKLDFHLHNIMQVLNFYDAIIQKLFFLFFIVLYNKTSLCLSRCQFEKLNDSLVLYLFFLW